MLTYTGRGGGGETQVPCVDTQEKEADAEVVPREAAKVTMTSPTRL